MNIHSRFYLKDVPAQRRGAMLPLLAVVMVILFVAAALSIDIARIHVTRSELRTATVRSVPYSYSSA